MQTNDLEQNVLEPLRAWIKEYRTFKDKMSVLDNTRLEFDAERRAFHKLEIKGVHHKQANDAVNPEISGKLEAKSGDVAGILHLSTLLVLLMVSCLCGLSTNEGIKKHAFTPAYATKALNGAADVYGERVVLFDVRGRALACMLTNERCICIQPSSQTGAMHFGPYLLEHT